MKKLIILGITLALISSTFGQQTTSMTRQDYFTKSRNQKTAAWCLLGGGFGMSVIGLAIGTASFWEEVFTEGGSRTFATGAVFFYAGIGAMIGSIPFFIAASKNKKRAMSISFKNETAPVIQKFGFAKRNMPSVNFRISL